MLHLCCVYLPPPIQFHILDEFLRNCNRVLESKNISKLLLIGDFNLGSLPWLPTQLTTNKSVYNNMLMDFTFLHELTQYNLIRNDRNNILDLVLSNINIARLTVSCNPLSMVDPAHPPLEFSIPFHPVDTLPLNNNIRFCFFKADYVRIVKDLNDTPWDEKLRGCETVDEMVSVFYSVLYTLIKKHVPISKPHSSKYPIWYSSELKNLLREKLKYRKKIRKYNSNPRDVISFDLLKKRCYKLSATCYKNYILQLEANMSSNPKLFWSFLKHKKVTKSSYPAKMFLDDKTSTNGNDICNLFADHFGSVYSADTHSHQSLISNECITSNYLSSIFLNENEILIALKHLDCFKGAGCDGIPAIFAHKCAQALVTPLHIIYNKSLSTGAFPSQWKKSLTIPLHKNGHKDSIKNYRPISILPVFGKLFEKLLYPYIAWHVKNIITLHQHGFTSSRSTATNLVAFTNNLTNSIDKKSCIDVIYTDFSKAFDSVNHNILIQKLSNCGITGILLNWCQSYLDNRQSKVAIKGYESNWFSTSSGVPQGSHLGPLFFNIFINDIQRCFLHSKYCLFADDMKIFKEISSSADVTSLQEDLDRLVNWCSLNKLSLNVDKCLQVRFCRKKSLSPSSYNVKGIILKEADTVRDLGVTLDCTLRLNTHIDTIVRKAFKNLGFVLRNCKDFKNPETKIVLYNALVRSGLEYCSVVWNPHYDVYIKRLESVQKRFLWHLSYQCNLSKTLAQYTDRLTFFNMDSLSNRRFLLDCLFLHNVVNGRIDCPQLLTLLRVSAPSRLPRQGKFNIFASSMSSTNLGKFSPLNRIVTNFNSISRKVDLDIFFNKKHTFRHLILKSLRSK